jgi:CheY-like chemotaxis protein
VSRAVLVVEDEPAMRLLIQEYLEFLGYPVLPAPDGATALDLAAGAEISVAFVDINLPDMNGVEVMRRVRDMGVGCPLVVLSGNLRESYADAIAGLDVDRVLEKPVDLDDLERVLEELAGKP